MQRAGASRRHPHRCRPFNGQRRPRLKFKVGQLATSFDMLKWDHSPIEKGPVRVERDQPPTRAPYCFVIAVRTRPQSHWNVSSSGGDVIVRAGWSLARQASWAACTPDKGLCHFRADCLIECAPRDAPCGRRERWRVSQSPTPTDRAEAGDVKIIPRNGCRSY